MSVTQHYLYLFNQMQQLPGEIKDVFFETVSGNLSLCEFEDWLYSNNELEYFLTADDYLELISFSYRKNSKYDLYKILKNHIAKSEFENWKLLKLLNAVLKRDKDEAVAIVSFYNLYCKGYYFLDNLAFGFSLPMNYAQSDMRGIYEIDPAERQKMIEGFHPQIENEIHKVIEWLNSKKIVITAVQDESDRYEFIDNRTEQEKIKTTYTADDGNSKAVANTDASALKPRWKFW